MDDEYTSPWKAYVQTHFKNNIKEVINYNYTGNMYPIFKDPYYNEMLIMWAQIHYSIPNDNEQICRQKLWHNANLQAGNECFVYNNRKFHKINCWHGKFLVHECHISILADKCRTAAAIRDSVGVLNVFIVKQPTQETGCDFLKHDDVGVG